jgi:hypothetical protein
VNRAVEDHSVPYAQLCEEMRALPVRLPSIVLAVGNLLGRSPKKTSSAIIKPTFSGLTTVAVHRAGHASRYRDPRERGAKMRLSGRLS